MWKDYLEERTIFNEDYYASLLLAKIIEWK